MGYSVERKHPRFDFKDLSWVFGLKSEKAAESGQPIRLEAKNISLGGCKFSSNRKIPLFDKVMITIFAKKTGELIASIDSKVVRLEEVDIGLGEKSFGIAVSFIEEPIGLKSKLEKP